MHLPNRVLYPTLRIRGGQPPRFILYNPGLMADLASSHHLVEASSVPHTTMHWTELQPNALRSPSYTVNMNAELGADLPTVMPQPL